MRARVEKVSPDLARRWLEKSEGSRQRGVRRNRVDKLAHAINSGQWQVTHQGIALDPDGVVLDGQHRLHAIVASDETVEVLVSRGVDPDVFHSIDTGASRTPADSLKIAGYTDTNVLASLVRTMLVYDEVAGTRGEGWTPLDRQVTTSDILEYLDEDNHRDLAYASIKDGRRIAYAVSRFGATTPISAANMICRTYPTDVGPDTLAEFNARLQDGVMLPSRSPILALRRWLVADTGYVNLSGATRRQVTVAIFLKAINDYALGLERSLSHFRWGHEVIPTPLAPGSREAFLQAQEDELAEEERASAQRTRKRA